MNHGSLFSGIGGFDLAAEWMGWQNVFHCEKNEFAQKILNYHFPKSILYEDITTTDFSIHRGTIDIITGGFPCQPYSQAGKRLGKEDDRHLWPEMLRAIREIQPRWIVGENVLGIINWNDGLVFEEVQTDLESEGYNVQAYVLPAASVHAPHQRYRTWFVAHSNIIDDQRGSGKFGGEEKEKRVQKRNQVQEFRDSGQVPSSNKSDVADTEDNGCGRGISKECSGEGRKVFSGKQERGTMGSETQRRSGKRSSSDSNDSGANESMRIDGYGKTQNEGREGFSQPELREDSEPIADTNGRFCDHANEKLRSRGDTSDQSGERFDADSQSPGFETRSEGSGKKQFRRRGEPMGARQWEGFPTQSPVCNGNDGIPFKLDGITFPKWRKESIIAGGNAVVPQLVYNIFKSIEAYETNTKG